ncbi:uncharacterized protein [Littorina saxatilis]|uniref:Ubiquitin-like domain-containing protein n=1 Tax=Littorina saxatilis TaxID=31220 RepID=A0AAN9AQY3_9CAEN
MVRSRTNRIVISQQDIRQTRQPEPIPPTVSNLSSSIFCTWCREDGRHFACLTEYSHPPDPESKSCEAPHDWTKGSEGWIPASGPCCEDCLEAAFERRRKAETGESHRELADEANTWCRERGQHVCHSLQRGWNQLRGWMERTKENLRQGHRMNEADRWCDVRFEAEGFLEVKVVVAREGAMQHLEVDFPTDVPVSMLKYELATLIDVPAEAQRWFYQAQQIDEAKTLDQLKVEIGGILEVKCQN